MAKTKLVKRNEEGTFDFRCPYADGTCGRDGEPFASTGWGKREHAVSRGRQHLNEHAEGKPMPELEQFWRDNGLTRETASRPNPDDWDLS